MNQTDAAGAVKAFHRARLMFAVFPPHGVLFGPAGDARGHKEWLESVFSGHGELRGRFTFADTLRGYLDGTGIYFYRGDFDATDADREVFLRYLPHVVILTDCDVRLHVFQGVVPGEPGTRWPGRKDLGAVDALVPNLWALA
jgi:hypothetical protein